MSNLKWHTTSKDKTESAAHMEYKNFVKCAFFSITSQKNYTPVGAHLRGKSIFKNLPLVSTGSNNNHSNKIFLLFTNYVSPFCSDSVFLYVCVFFLFPITFFNFFILLESILTSYFQLVFFSYKLCVVFF